MDYGQKLEIFHVLLQVVDLYNSQIDESQIDYGLIVFPPAGSDRFYGGLFSQKFCQRWVRGILVGSFQLIVHHCFYVQV